MKVITEKKIAAGIVLYNPEDPVRLKKSIESVLSQVVKVYVFDNSMKPVEFPLRKNVIYKFAQGNKGIAFALNQIMEMAKEDGFEWVITMDQDSVLPDGIIKDFEKYIGNDKIGIICPQVIDKRRSYMEVNEQVDKEYISMCITSASCTFVKAWEKIGGYDEWLFVDLVDNEFCKRLTVSNYKILRLNKWVLDQEFGKIIPKSPAKQRFWVKVGKVLHNNNFAKFSYKKFVNPMRVYYTNRNIIYVNRKLKPYGRIAYENYNSKGYLGFLISFNVPSFLRAEKKIEVLKAIFKGIRDGHKKKVKQWTI